MTHVIALEDICAYYTGIDLCKDQYDRNKILTEL